MRQEKNKFIQLEKKIIQIKEPKNIKTSRI